MTNIAVVGPGAIGCAIGAALLERDDHNVVFCARTPFEQIIISVEDGPPTTFDVRCETDPSAVEHADVVLLCTKANQTESAREWLEATAGPNTLVAILQNGVEHIERVRPYVPEAQLVPVVVMLPATRTAPGVIARGTHTELIAPDDPAGHILAELFAATPMQITLAEDWTTRAWMKLLMNAASGGICALTRRSNKVFLDPEAKQLLITIMSEAAEVGRAEGAVLKPDIAERIAERMLQGAGEHLNSITADRIEGRPTEWEARNEVVVRKAAKHGIDVPLNRTVTTLLRLGEPNHS